MCSTISRQRLVSASVQPSRGLKRTTSSIFKKTRTASTSRRNCFWWWCAFLNLHFFFLNLVQAEELEPCDRKSQSGKDFQLYHWCIFQSRQIPPDFSGESAANTTCMIKEWSMYIGIVVMSLGGIALGTNVAMIGKYLLSVPGEEQVEEGEEELRSSLGSKADP
ncbi:unnamed protein product [Amoebophrya sp. A25]|nr:unnamed protein product [Amoebophrya sp. A25]|eukprot:GSA25T00026259001.1